MIAAPPTAQPAIASLPVFGTILRGYQAARQAGTLIVLAIVWTAIAAGTGYLAEDLTHALSDLRAHYTFPAAVRDEATQLVPYAELLVAASLIGVTVYRAIILVEEPRWDALWRIGRREMRYLALVIMFSVPVHVGMRSLAIAFNLGVAPVTLQQALMAVGIPVLRVISLVMLAHLIVSIALTPFFALAFPLIAIGAPGGVLRRSMRMSRSHRMRLGAIGFLASLPLIPLVYAPYLAGTAGTATLATLQSTATMFLSLLASALVSAVFAVAFQRVTARLNKGTYDAFD
jgi:hypothetical protein